MGRIPGTTLSAVPRGITDWTSTRDPFIEYKRDYLSLETKFHADMTLMDYCLIKYQNMPIEANKGNMYPHNMEFIKKVGKLTIHSFDGSFRCSTQAWVQNLDTISSLTR
jgi:hypothetical protein